MPDRMLGRQLGPYTLRSILGKGGMGKVYLADDAEGMEVAVKVLPLDDEAGGSLAIRFKREIQACLELDHMHVVRLHDAGSEDDCDWYSMEVLEGETLQQILRRRGRLPLDEVLRIARELGEALAYVHGRGVIHRDIKPGNVMLVRNGRTVLMDFGLAKVLDRTRITKTGHGLGTPRYMAPEMLLAKEPTAATDLYQVGVVLYELLSGETAVKAKSFATLAQELTKVYPPELGKLDPGIPAALDALIFNCLEKDPRRRYQRAEDFLAALDRVEAGEEVGSLGKRGTLRMDGNPDDSMGDMPTAEGPRSMPSVDPTAATDVATAAGPAAGPGPVSGPGGAPRVSPGAGGSGPHPDVDSQSVDDLGFSLGSLSNPVIVRQAGRGVVYAAGAVAALLVGAWVFGPGRAVDHRLREAVQVRVSPAGAEVRFATLAPVPSRVRWKDLRSGETGEAGRGGEPTTRHEVEVRGLASGRHEVEVLFPDGAAEHRTSFEVPPPGAAKDVELVWTSAREATLRFRAAFPVRGEVRFVAAGKALERTLPWGDEEVRTLTLPVAEPFSTVRDLRLALEGVAGHAEEHGPFDFEGLDGQLIETLAGLDPAGLISRARDGLPRDGAGARKAASRLRDAIPAAVTAGLDQFRPLSRRFFEAAEVPLARKLALFHAFQRVLPVDFLAGRAGVPPPLDVGRLAEDFLEVSPKLSFLTPGGGIPSSWEHERHVWVRGNDVFRPTGVDPDEFAASLARFEQAYGNQRVVHDEGSVAVWLPEVLPSDVEVELVVANLSPEFYVALDVNDRLSLVAHDPRAPALEAAEAGRPLSEVESRVVFKVPPEVLRTGRNDVAVRLRSLGGVGDLCTILRQLAVYYRSPEGSRGG